MTLQCKVSSVRDLSHN